MKILVKSSIVGLVPVVTFELWREREKQRIRRLAEHLSQYGSVQVSGSNSKTKADAWNTYLPKLLETWDLASKSMFKIEDKTTWPQIANGRAHQYAHRGVSDYPINVWRDHYEAQAVVACFIDSKLDGSVHWGESSHWKLKLLFNPLKLVFSNVDRLNNHQSLPSNLHHTGNGIGNSIAATNAGKESINEIQLEGNENAWGISCFPSKMVGSKRQDNSATHLKSSDNRTITLHPVEGLATPQHGHIDGGRRGYFMHHGLPPYSPHSQRKEDEHSKDINLDLMQILATQTVIQLYCCTPGAMKVQHGATGIYESSHLLIAGALQHLLMDKDFGDKIPFNCVIDALKQLSLSSTQTNNEELGVCSTRNESSTEGALRGLLRQPELDEDKTTLMVGTCVHGSMYATEPMKLDDGREMPRVIFNAKSFVAGSPEDTLSGRNGLKLERFTRQTFSPSLARQVMLHPEVLWEKTGRDKSDFDHRVAAMIKEIKAMTASRSNK